MKSRNENLIEILRGSVAQLEELPNQIKDVTVFTETGHVDVEFYVACLECVNEFMAASNLVITLMSELLGPELTGTGTNKQSAKKEGADWSVEEILRHCTLEDNVMKLPKVQFNRKAYAEAKKWIEEAGGKWKGGKVNGFTFDFNADRVFSVLKEGKRCNLAQEFQFFATPPELADWLVAHAGVSKDDKILEPSAGTGAIVDAVLRSCPECQVDCFELMPENQEILLQKEGVNLIGEDFLQSQANGYTRIFANPPFSKNQDVKHVLEMYSRLADGGILAAIMSQHWKLASDSLSKEFGNFLRENDAKVYDINAGEFKESGTNIATCCVVIEKKK